MKKVFLYTLVAVSLISCKNKTETSSADVTNNKSTKPENIDEGFVAGDSKDFVIPAEDTLKNTTILWIDTLKDLGNIPKKGLVDVSFRFKNTGTKPLSIINVSAGCGCTAPQKPAKFIQPGEESEVKAKFNTENQSIGPVNKSVTVVTNTNPSAITLFFKANITQ